MVANETPSMQGRHRRSRMPSRVLDEVPEGVDMGRPSSLYRVAAAAGAVAAPTIFKLSFSGLFRYAGRIRSVDNVR